jgi:hypothetical protein
MGDDITDPNAAPPLWPLVVITGLGAGFIALCIWLLTA